MYCIVLIFYNCILSLFHIEQTKANIIFKLSLTKLGTSFDKTHITFLSVIFTEIVKFKNNNFQNILRCIFVHFFFGTPSLKKVYIDINISFR